MAGEEGANTFSIIQLHPFAFEDLTCTRFAPKIFHVVALSVSISFVIHTARCSLRDTLHFLIAYMTTSRMSLSLIKFVRYVSVLLLF